MGLFDIFKRRAQTPASPAPADDAASATTESEATAGVDQDGATTSDETSTATDPSAASVASDAVSDEPESSAPLEGTPTSDNEPVADAVTATDRDAETDAMAHEEVDSATPLAAQSGTPASTATAPASQADGEILPAAESEATPADEPAVAASAAPANTDEAMATDEQVYDHGLEKTRMTFGQRLNALLANFRSVDESFFDDLEETLIGADVGFDMAMKISDELRDEVKLQNAKKPQEVQALVIEKMIEIYDREGNGESSALQVATSGPTVILFVGVNGVGKTTTIGKLAHLYHQQGKKVLLAAADTFRAGATEQLAVWAKRDQVDIVTGSPQSDPAAVVYDAVDQAKRDQYDILFVDTAGRLQNKVNLMNELTKMKRIITRELPSAPHEVLLVLDATTGQNALTQAKLFKESTDVTGIVLTKLDGTARGGIVLAIRNELHLPVKFVGLGEQATDLRPFSANEFVYGLFKGLIDVNLLNS